MNIIRTINEVYQDLDYLILWYENNGKIQEHIKQPLANFTPNGPCFRTLLEFYDVNSKSEQVNDVIDKVNQVVDILKNNFEDEFYFMTQNWTPLGDDEVKGVYILVSSYPFTEILNMRQLRDPISPDSADGKAYAEHRKNMDAHQAEKDEE